MSRFIYQKFTSDSFKMSMIVITIVSWVVILTFMYFMSGCSSSMHPVSSDVMDFMNEGQHESISEQCIKCHVHKQDSIDPDTYIIRPWGGEIITE